MESLQWWLRSAGYGSYTAAYVGSVDGTSSYVNCNHGVRPALIIKNPELLKLTSGHIYKVNGILFEQVIPGVLLSKNIIGEHPFRTSEHCIEMSDCKNGDWYKEDKPYNEYATSDIKKYVDDWFQKL